MNVVTKRASRSRRFLCKGAARRIGRDIRRAHRAYRSWVRQELRGWAGEDDIDLAPFRHSHRVTERDVI